MRRVGVASEVGAVAADRRSRVERWTLACFVAGYSVMHHSGFFGTASAGRGTRIADWIDLVTPFVVVLPLLAFLASQRPPLRWWVVAAIGSVLYVQGHGIHLAANSVSNVKSGGPADPGVIDAVHVWDEVVGHYVWYVGLAVVVAACAASVHARTVSIPTPVLVVGGAVCGVTWATNGLEGGTAVLSLALAAVAVIPVLRHGRGLSPALAAAGVTACVILGVYGLWHTGFPQPSSL